MWTNFHMHSKYCDGKGELKDYVQQAIEWRMPSIGFSSHAPLNFPCSWCMKSDMLDSYLDELEFIKASTPELQIYKGLEIDFIPGVISADDFRQKLDYTIGSIHFVDTFPDGRPWEIDGSHTTFLEGLEKIFHGNSRAAFTRYFELTRQMIDDACPTVVGHLDKIKIQNIENKFFHEDDAWYQEQLNLTIEKISTHGAIVEVNARGLYQGKSTSSYPSPWILKKLLNRNVAVTLSSDAHHPSDLINRFPELAKQLLDTGFTKLSILHDGSWKPFSFNVHGIIQ
ncbi:MAG: histidinol-phosphatase [Chryseolinea sp.]